MSSNIQREQSVDPDCLRFLGHVLEGYFAWRSNNPNLEPPCSARVWRTPEPIEHRRVLNLSDDQFVRVDAAFGSCERDRPELAQALLQEYTSSGEAIQKARRCGFAGKNAGAVRGAYKARVRLAEVQMYWLLTPDLQAWQEQREREREEL